MLMSGFHLETDSNQELNYSLGVSGGFGFIANVNFSEISE